MVDRNPNFEKLPQTYLFAKMAKIAADYDDILDLSIGDTSLPIAKEITEKMEQKAAALGTKSGYRGYGSGQGEEKLRSTIAAKLNVEPDEVFISDGAKSDIGRLQLLFGSNVTIAVQDPAYPVYVDTSRLLGQNRVIFLPCTQDNGFFPTLEKADLIYFCSPHNPTGYAATFDELTKLVAFAKEHHSIIIYDAAYSSYIQDPNCPKSIYEVPGAKEVAIEVSSFSKSFGFTGVRLGWSVVPKALTYTDGRPLHPDWLRIANTFFNGASNIVQAGGIAAALCPPSIAPYQENSRILKEALAKFPTVGGKNAPYLWSYFGGNSWEQFQHLLEKTGVLSIPGSGFGPSGEGFLRFSALGDPNTVQEAARRLAAL